MGIRSIETAAEGLNKLTEEYTNLLNKFDKNINDRMQLLQIHMELVEKSQKKFDQPIDFMLQAGMIASAFFVGPLGLAIGQAVLQGYRIAKSDGNWKQKTVNSLIAAAKSEAAQYILNYTTSKTTTLPDGSENVSNWRSYSPQLLSKIGVLPDSDKVRYEEMNTMQQIAVYGGSYSAGTTVDSFLSTVPSGTGLEQVGSSKENYKSNFSVSGEDEITLAILKSASRDMSWRIFRLKDVLGSRENYKKITYYFALSMATQNINIRSSHLGLKSREIIKMFYTGALSQSTEDKYLGKRNEIRATHDENYVLDLLKQNNNEIHQAAKTSRKNLLNFYKSQVTDSEIFARSTDYQRVYETFALENDVPNWARIDYKNQSNSLYYFYKHAEPVNEESGFKELHQINSENFFKLLDSKILVRAYFDDYSDFYQKKIAGSLKRKLHDYMPARPIEIQKHWKSIGNNQSRVKDIIIIYFLISIPQILLGAPLVSQLIIDHKNDDKLKDIQNIQIERVFASIFNGVWAACSFHKQTRSSYTNNQIWNRVSPFIDQISDLLFTPFCSIKSITPGIENPNKEQLDALGISNKYIVDNTQGYKRKDILLAQLDNIKFEKLNSFIKATTPGVERRENVSKFERKNSMYEGDLFNFDDNGIIDQVDMTIIGNRQTLKAKYIFKKLLARIKKYINDKDEVKSLADLNFINRLPTKDNKYSYTKDADRNRDKLIAYYGEKGISTNKFSNGGYLESAIGKVDSKKQIIPDHSNINIPTEVENLFLQQKFSIEALQMNKATQEEVLKNMHKTMVALGAKLFSN